jgi:hypothetical protein
MINIHAVLVNEKKINFIMTDQNLWGIDSIAPSGKPFVILVYFKNRGLPTNEGLP